MSAATAPSVAHVASGLPQVASPAGRTTTRAPASTRLQPPGTSVQRKTRRRQCPRKHLRSTPRRRPASRSRRSGTPRRRRRRPTSPSSPDRRRTSTPNDALPPGRRAPERHVRASDSRCRRAPDGSQLVANGYEPTTWFTCSCRHHDPGRVQIYPPGPGPGATGHSDGGGSPGPLSLNQRVSACQVLRHHGGRSAVPSVSGILGASDRVRLAPGPKPP
jgi:hypothetical protein